jgi:hypothetical protein
VCKKDYDEEEDQDKDNERVKQMPRRMIRSLTLHLYRVCITDSIHKELAKEQIHNRNHDDGYTNVCICYYATFKLHAYICLVSTDIKLLSICILH